VRGVQPQGGEDRKDVVREEPLEIGPLGGQKVTEADQLDAVPGELRQDALEQQGALPALPRPDPGADLGELLGRRAAVGRHPLRPALLLQLQSTDALHEELVEVAAEDGEELEPLEQRHARIFRLGQDPPLNSSQESSRLRNGEASSAERTSTA
jgi:hypothetical protein